MNNKFLTNIYFINEVNITSITSKSNHYICRHSIDVANSNSCNM